MKFVVFGLGYVGSSTAVLLSRKHDVYAIDLNEERVNDINARRSPIGDALMHEILQEKDVQLKAQTEYDTSLIDADYIIIATNTELNEETGVLNTTSVEAVIETIVTTVSETDSNHRPVIMIKSTIPVGFTKAMAKQYPTFTFMFCPEFLREKSAMDDVLRPNRIIVGYDKDDAKQIAEAFVEGMVECFDEKDAPIVYTNTEEAEAIKLFSNTYLATRIAFFNELDSFAMYRGLDSNTIIRGVCLDPRIGDWYNVPGPGYGGACLPKDTRQLLSDFKDLPETLIRGVIESNELRKEFVKKNQKQ